MRRTVACLRIDLDNRAGLANDARVSRLLARLALLLAFFSSACGSGDPAPPPAAPSPPPAALDVVPPPAPAPPAPAGYEVHEWGLLSVDALPGAPAGPVTLAAVPWRSANPLGTGGGGGSGPAPHFPMGAGLGKPVLYVHLADGTDEVTFTARVTLPGAGTIAEHWPLRTLDAPGTVTWSGVRAHRGVCGPRRYPALNDPPCNGRDGCEAAELATYETADGACLSAQGDFDHLFYRGELPTLEAPLVVQRGSLGAIVARNPTSELIGPFVVRVTVRGARLSVLVSDAVGEGGEVSIPSPTAAPIPTSAVRGAPARAAGIQALEAGMRGIGLTQPEIDAFGRAWWDEIFSTSAPQERRGRLGDHGTARVYVVRDELIYWVPQGLADRAATLHFEPPPRAIRRALLVRQAL